MVSHYMSPTDCRSLQMPCIDSTTSKVNGGNKKEQNAHASNESAAMEKASTISKVTATNPFISDKSKKEQQFQFPSNSAMKKKPSLSMAPCTVTSCDVTLCEPLTTIMKSPAMIEERVYHEPPSTASSPVGLPSAPGSDHNVHEIDIKGSSGTVTPPLDPVVLVKTLAGSSDVPAMMGIEGVSFPTDLPPPHFFTPPGSLYINSFQDDAYKELVSPVSKVTFVESGVPLDSLACPNRQCEGKKKKKRHGHTRAFLSVPIKIVKKVRKAVKKGHRSSKHPKKKVMLEEQ